VVTAQSWSLSAACSGINSAARTNLRAPSESAAFSKKNAPAPGVAVWTADSAQSGFEKKNPESREKFGPLQRVLRAAGGSDLEGRALQASPPQQARPADPRGHPLSGPPPRQLGRLIEGCKGTKLHFKEGTFCASEFAGIEPTLPAPEEQGMPAIFYL
jgi:hypothetical protein